jgi:hypothetical protein
MLNNICKFIIDLFLLFSCVNPILEGLKLNSSQKSRFDLKCKSYHLPGYSESNISSLFDGSSYMKHLVEEDCHEWNYDHAIVFQTMASEVCLVILQKI